MQILIVGNGGREHALTWVLREADALFIAPGNPGTEQLGMNVPIKVEDTEGLVAFAKKENIDLVVVGSEVPLANGLADAFQDAGISCFGPSASAAEIESSKVFSKGFMQRHGIPTAAWQHFDSTQMHEAKAYAHQLGKCVVKASGLAAGKGAIMCEDRFHSDHALRDAFISEKFGEAGKEVVIEEWMQGEEASVFVFTDGDDYLLLEPAQDHKRLLDQDLGPNTGGMGAYAPAPVITPDLMELVRSRIIEPTLEGMAHENRLYKGCLYVGLMITDQGPKVVEFNCRLGDPEAQVVLPLIGGDAEEIFWCSATHGIGNLRLSKSSQTAACVVLASGGYGSDYRTGYPIHGLSEANEVSDVVIFHAGTKSQGDQIITAGGRVLGVTAVRPTLAEAVRTAYQAAELIEFEQKHCRRDIGHRALSRE